MYHYDSCYGSEFILGSIHLYFLVYMCVFNLILFEPHSAIMVYVFIRCILSRLIHHLFFLLGFIFRDEDNKYSYHEYVSHSKPCELSSSILQKSLELNKLRHH